MKLQGAIVKQKSVTFAVVKVDKDVLDVAGRARDIIPRLQPVFPQMSVVLVAHDSEGTPKFYGRPDIVQKMSSFELTSVEWKEFTLD